MKKKFLITILFVLSFTFSVILFGNLSKVDANSVNGYRIEQVFKDKFNKSELDSSWKMNEASLELNYYGIHCLSPVPYGSGIIINAATLDERSQINFTIIPQSGQNQSNISFNIGMESPTGSQAEPYVDCRVQLWNDQIAFMDWQHNLAVNPEKLTEHVINEFSGLYSSLIRTDVSIYIERKSATLTHIYVEYYREGELVYSSKSKPFELIDPRYPNGYCGFFWDVVEMDVTNFEFYNNDNLMFEDDLSTGALTYSATDYNLGNFHINSNLNESNVFVSSINSVLMDSNNESIINSNSLTKLENISNPYDIAFSLKVNKLENNSFYGIGLGLKDTDTKIDANNAIGFIKRDSLTAEIVLLKNGEIDRTNSYQIALSKIANGKYINYSIKLSSDNKISFTVNGVTYSFSNIDYLGLVGIGLVRLDNSESSSSIEVNEFSVTRNVYVKNLAPDADNDFKGEKIPDADDPEYVEAYLNNQRFFLGTNVNVEKDWLTGEQALTFNSCTPYSGFGYASELTEWIVEFDVEVLTRQQNNYLGISFGRKSLIDLLTPASTSNSSFLLRCDGTGIATSQVTYGSFCCLDDGSTSRVSTVNIYDKDNTKSHFMFIGKNRNVYVYYKLADSPDSDMSILRATMNNVNIDGYVAIVGLNNVSFNVSNFKIVNLLDDCKEKSDIALRETFDSIDTISDKLELDPMSDIVNEQLVLSNSTLKTTTERLFEIIRFTSLEIEDSMQIMFSKNKKIVFDVINNKLTIKEGTKVTNYEVSEINLKNVKSKRFEIYILGDEVTLSYKGYYDPLDKLSKIVISHKFDTAIEKDYITFSANGNVIIDDLYIFALDNSEVCKTYNYEDDPNNAPTWTVKPDFDASKVYDPSKETEKDSKKGCGSNMLSTSLILLLLLVLSSLAIKRKEVK